MTKQVQFRRGNTTEHSSFTGKLGEVTVDTDKDTLVVHDGLTVGGFPIASEASLGSLSTQDSNNINITGGSITGITDLTIADGGTGASDAAGARINLELGSLATQDFNNINITGGLIVGMLDPVVSSGVATKNYVDEELTVISASALTGIVDDLTPQLGANLDAQNFKIINLGEPASSSDATTKNYVDSVATGLDIKNSVRAATTTTLVGGVYTAGTSEGQGTWAVTTGQVVDGVTLNATDRVLVKDESGTDREGHGIWVYDGTTGFIRATDADNTPENEVSGGMFTFIEEGTQADTGWVMSFPNGVAIVDTVSADNLIFTQFSNIGGLIDADTLDGLNGSDFLQVALSQAYTQQKYFASDALVDGGAISWNLDDSQVASVTLGGDRTLSSPTNMEDGATYILTVKQDGTGSRTLSYGGAYKWPGGTPPTLSTSASAVDIITFISDGTNMFGVAQNDFS